MIIKISNLILIILIYSKLTAKCETIHFTNSPQHLLNSNNFTTYKIEVPGSKPITIIEANKDSDYENREETLVTKKYSKDNYNLNDGKLKLETALGLTVTDRDNRPSAYKTSDNHHDNDNIAAAQSNMRKTVYSPVLLNKFLKEYAEKLSNLDPLTKEKLNEIVKINQRPNETDDDRHKEEEQEVIKEIDSMGSSSGSGIKNFQRKSYHPYNVKDGWVTLEAIPWSSSKISKWQSHNNNKHHGSPYSTSGVNSWHEEDSAEIPQHGSHFYDGGSVSNTASSSHYHPNSNHNKPAYGFSNTSPNFQKPFGGNYDGNDDDRRPLKPDYYLTGTVNQQDTWYEHGYKPISHSKPWSSDPEIVTDNRPSNFPRYPPSRPNYNEYPNDRIHQPQSYPNSGNEGEWVLISTTKGYQYPRRHGQRAISITPSTDVSVHKGVRLTVLPYDGPDAVKGTITTSHNGLLEVAPNSKPIDSYVNSSNNNNNNNNNSNNNNNINKINKTTKGKKKPMKKIPLTSKNSVSDSSAVLAAAAAGMVPATMAILAPMVLGRRRRRRDIIILHNPYQLEPETNMY